MRPEHLPLLHELASDAEVVRFLLGRARTHDEIAEFWGPRCAETRADAYGIGWWGRFVYEITADEWRVGRTE